MNSVNDDPATPDPTSVDELREWQQRIWNMPGRVPHAELRDLKQCTEFVGAVAAEFESHMAVADDTDTAVMLARDGFNTAEFAEFTAVVHRRLFALVSALYSRVEYQRRWVKRVGWTEGTEGHGVYRSEITKLGRDGAHEWIMGLRRVLIHRSLPDTGAEASFSRSTPGASLDTFDLRWFLVRDRLLREHPGEWSSAAKGFMAKTGPQIYYRDVLTSYTDRAFRMDRSMAEAYAEEHLDELEAFHAEIRRHDAFVRRHRH